ncbi:MAG: putative O-glycosylation ligase, exosortase A system-associated [Rubrivivax sp.]|nr:putative O-glycosylation ligase, exosortase A system-associated [Rubrivivax sp.]
MPLRDLALTAVFAVLLLMVFKHPAMGAYLWAWLGLMNPHKLTYGFAFTFPFAQVTALVTLLAVLFTKQKQKLPINGIVVILLLMVGWMTLTSFFAIAPREDVIDRWVFVMKIQLMLLVTWMLVCDARQLRILVWVVTLSVAFYGIKGGVWTVVTGGGGRVWGPPGGLLQGNNELAVGLTMLMPMLYFLRQTSESKWVRHALLFSMGSCFFSIVGTQSRGALLALGAMTFFLGLKGKHPVRSSVTLLVLMVAVIGFMPETWSGRMSTIKTYQDDTSAMSRIWTWITLYNAAVDRPLVGAGFVADNAVVFARYAPIHEPYRIFAGSVYVAHSIYFQMLGEHGFVGLFLFLLLGLTTWITAGRLARRTRDDPEFGAWMPLLMRMVQVSMIGYAVGGAFLSLAYLDLPYYIMGFVVLSDALTRSRARQVSRAGQVGVHPAPPARAQADLGWRGR